MNRPLKRVIIALSVTIFIAAALLLGAAWYLLDYALQPGE